MGKDSSELRIDRDYYEESGYFTGGGSHLLTPESRFHRYRIREVLRGCGTVEGLHVLDLGCGWGTISFALADRGAQAVVGIDFAKAAIRLCEERLHQKPLQNLSFLRGDAGDTGLDAGKWDLIVAADLVEHLYPEDTIRVYRESLRLLRPGGRLLVWTPNPGHLLERLRFAGILRADPTHVDYKTLQRCIGELTHVGFQILTAEHRPSHLPVLSWVESVGQTVIPILRRRILVVAERP
jgi:2-polyprenyl-3-methyl-5-hydroxy-6-metoxy-1,4-benzoquinol methylase